MNAWQKENLRFDDFTAIDELNVVIDRVLTKYMCEEIMHDRLFNIY